MSSISNSCERFIETIYEPLQRQYGHKDIISLQDKVNMSRYIRQQLERWLTRLSRSRSLSRLRNDYLTQLELVLRTRSTQSTTRFRQVFYQTFLNVMDSFRETTVVRRSSTTTTRIRRPSSRVTNADIQYIRHHNQQQNLGVAATTVGGLILVVGTIVLLVTRSK